MDAALKAIHHNSHLFYLLFTSSLECFLSYSIPNMPSQVTPGNRGTCCFWSVSAAAAAAATSAAVFTAAVPPTLFNFPGKPLKLISSTWLTYGCGNFFLNPSRWPWVMVTKLPNAIYLVPTIRSEPFIQSLQNLVGICFSTWLNFGEIPHKKNCDFFS